MNNSKPTVLCLSGHDPCGGAGIQADIETIASHHCHPCSVITALTEQDTSNVNKLIPQNADDIVSQARTILEDIPVSAFKIGLVGHVETALAIETVLREQPDIPVILDPVLAAGGGTRLSNAALIEALVELLLPRTTILTPNSEEVRILTGETNLEQCGLALLDKGCEYVLITGTHEQTTHVTNQLFHDGKCIETYTWDRLPYSYHGSGCTLSSSIAALMAHGLDAVTAVNEAQEYTWNALNEAFKPGQGQHLPNRFFWMQESE